jgi:hypothetical protein
MNQVFKKFFLFFIFSTNLWALRLPPVIDLKVEGDKWIGNEYIKTLNANEEITFTFEDGRKHYVEQLFITAEGAQSRFSFAKVYADGDEIATLGVPGYDPDYPVVVRGEVSEIKLKVQDRSRIKIRGFKIYTEEVAYESYTQTKRHLRSSYALKDWGYAVAVAVEEIMKLNFGKPEQFSVFSTYLKPLKIAALHVQASDNARDVKSIHTKKLVKDVLLPALNNIVPYLESDKVLIDEKYYFVSLDLLTIRADIKERYDLK